MKDSLVHHAHKVHLLRLLGQTGSLRRASVEAGVTPSAFSQSMTQLESFLGKTLIRRTREGALLTEEGQALVDALSPLLDGFDAYTPGQAGQQAIRQKLVIGAYDSIAITVFPKILPTLRRKYPHLRLNVITARSHQLYSALRSGEMDLAIVIESDESTNLDTVRVAEERLGLYVSSRHEIRGESCVDAVNKYGLATISSGPNGYPRYYQKFLKPFGEVQNVITTDSFETVRHLTLSGSVVGVLPSRVAQRASEDLTEISSVDSKSKKNFDSLHHFALVSRKNLAPKIKTLLLDEIKEALKK